MFGHRDSRTSDDKRRCRRNVKGVGTITAGSTRVDHHRIVDLHTLGHAPHSLDRTGYFINGLTLYSEAHQISCNLGLRCSTTHDF